VHDCEIEIVFSIIPESMDKHTGIKTTALAFSRMHKHTRIKTTA
jgi:hypothetical protein